MDEPRATRLVGTVLACSLAVSAGLLDSAVPARAASTSQARGRAHCRPDSPGPVPGVIPAMVHPRVITQDARHDRSC